MNDTSPEQTEPVLVDELSSVDSLAGSPSLKERATAAHRLNRRLVSISVWLLVAVFAFGGSLALFIMNNSTEVPRTQVDRELVVAKAFLEANPDRSDAWARYGRAQAVFGDIDGALATIAQGLEHTGDEGLLLAEGDVLRLGKRYTEAVATYNRAEKHYRQQAAAAQAEGKPSTVSIEISEYLAQVAYGRGLCELAIGDTQAALKDFEDSVAFYPRSADSWVALGDAYATLGFEQSAEDAYREALRYVPDHAGALQGLIRTGGGSGGE